MVQPPPSGALCALLPWCSLGTDSSAPAGRGSSAAPLVEHTSAPTPCLVLGGLKRQQLVQNWSFLSSVFKGCTPAPRSRAFLASRVSAETHPGPGFPLEQPLPGSATHSEPSAPSLVISSLNDPARRALRLPGPPCCGLLWKLGLAVKIQAFGTRGSEQHDSKVWKS